jgi:hypothetical protein
MNPDRITIARIAVAMARMAPATPESDSALKLVEAWCDGKAPGSEHPVDRERLAGAIRLLDNYSSPAHFAARNTLRLALQLDVETAEGDEQAMLELAAIPDHVGSGLSDRHGRRCAGPRTQERYDAATRAGAYRLCGELARHLPPLVRWQVRNYWELGEGLPRDWEPEPAICWKVSGVEYRRPDAPMRYAVIALPDGGAEIRRYPDDVKAWPEAFGLHDLGGFIGESDTLDGGPPSSYPTAEAIRDAYLEARS